MSECANVEVREMLLDLLHGALQGEVRDGVERHVAECSDCEAELALLASARRAMAARPVSAVSVASIVRALPLPDRRSEMRPEMRSAMQLELRAAMKPDVRPALQPAARRRAPSMAFRLAAAVSFISLGGISVAVARSYFGAGETIVADSVVSQRTDSVIPVAPATGAGVVPGASGTTRTVSMLAGISDLGDADLASLFGELDTLEAAPAAEPDPTPGGRVVAGSVTGS
ncbi:MAG: zf-HC2 domain-containing protein [Gemmatimonadaceae bacterium]|nr:zf-HC2 domain-containing protein [Gemmatimonadaceae bacterium]